MTAEDFPVVVEESTVSKVRMAVETGMGAYTIHGSDEDGDMFLRGSDGSEQVFFPTEDLAALCRLSSMPPANASGARRDRNGWRAQAPGFNRGGSEPGPSKGATLMHDPDPEAS